MIRRTRGFNLLELLISLAVGITLIAAFLVVLQHSRRDLTASESLSRLQDSARHAMSVVAADIEHAGFYGFAPAGRVQLVRAGATLAENESLAQSTAESPVAAVAGLPPGAHDCGLNFAVDLWRAVQGSDNRYALGEDASDCAPTASAGDAREAADTLTLRHASQGTASPQAGRVQLYTTARASSAALLVFADGRAPGSVDDSHEIRDLEVRSYYVASNSVGRRGWPALRVKSLTESRGMAQFRDEEVMPGVEDLQVEFAVASLESGERRVRYVGPDSPWARAEGIVAVRLWLRLRADVTESGHHDDRELRYANVVFSPSANEARHRRMLVERTVAVRNRS